MLDEERRLRRFTRRAASFLELTAADVGRHLGDLALPIVAPDLELWIARSMELGILVEAEVHDRSDRWHRLQIRPRRAPEGQVDGAILSLVDIDELRSEVLLAQGARDSARSIVDAVQVPLLVLDAGLRVLSANAAYYQHFLGHPAETEGRRFFELGAGAWDTPELQQAVAGSLGEAGRFQALELKRDFPGRGPRTISVSGGAITAPSREPMLLLGLEDVTGAPRPRAPGDPG
jgi:two-component system CheB/CheR fusion protein